MSDTLQNKIAVITGGGDGVGLEIASALVARNARANLTSRNRDSLPLSSRIWAMPPAQLPTFDFSVVLGDSPGNEKIGVWI